MSIKGVFCCVLMYQQNPEAVTQIAFVVTFVVTARTVGVSLVSTCTSVL
jgi:hypothetical protein